MSYEDETPGGNVPWPGQNRVQVIPMPEDPNYSDAMHRYRAVELAIRCIEGFETPESIVERAKAFSEFIIG
jgi:hypothetical protein